MDSRVRSPGLEHLAIAGVVLAGWLANADAMGDNSMLLHLRTGVDMFESGAVPRHDPYAFTSGGGDWVVQSWLAEWTYGALHALGGWHLVIVEQMVLGAATALFVALVARGGSLVRTAIPCVIALTMAFPAWSSRPALFGGLFFAALVFVVERRRSPWWLLPIGWLWVNTHGSFPIGLAWLFLVVAGALLDERRLAPDVSRRAAVFLAGVLLGALNPLGLDLLTFSFRLFGERGRAFENIVEWASPNFHEGTAVVTLLALCAAVLVLARGRVAWRHVLPFVGLLAASLYASRNFAFLAVALVPGVRAAVANVTLLDRRSTVSPFFAGVTGGVLMIVAVTAVVVVQQRPALALDRYPQSAYTWMEHAGLLAEPHRVATQDVVGCYRNFRYGADGRAFIDDRYDMYPVEVIDDYMDLLAGTADPDEILARRGVDVVLWERTQPLGYNLGYDARWKTVYSDDDWSVFVRRG